MHRAYKRPARRTGSAKAVPASEKGGDTAGTDSATRRLARGTRPLAVGLPVVDTAGGGEERRRFQRMAMSVTAVLELQGSLPRPVEIRELSPLGVRVAQLGNARLGTGELVRLRFEAGGVEVALACHVAWVSRGGLPEFGGRLLLELSSMADRVRYAHWIVSELARNGA